MEKKSSTAHQKSYISRGLIPGAIIGGILGILIGFLYRNGTLITYGLSIVFYSFPFNEMITGLLLGAVIGGLIGMLLTFNSEDDTNTECTPKTNTQEQSKYDADENVTLKLKEEQLDIAKKWIKTGEVRVYREEFSEEKTFTVPVKREELVIEKKSFDPDASEAKDVPAEIIRIPLSEERVEFSKHKVVLEDVSVYKQQIEDIKHIEETLKREELKVKISGSPKVKDKQD